MNTNDYIDIENAKRITGLARTTLLHYAQDETIRSIKIPCADNGGFMYRYHIDDCRQLSWPGPSDVSKAAGVSNQLLLWHIGNHTIPAARKVRTRWKFPPRVADMLVKWARSGFPDGYMGIRRR